MLARLYALAAVAALCASGVGCRTVSCGDSCSHGHSMAFQKYDCSCDDACGGRRSGRATQAGCATPCADECADGCCGTGRCRGRGLKGWLSRLGGCTGCGEMYWSEWHNDPPCVYEPCDQCGRFTGGDCGCSAYRAPYRLESGYATREPASSQSTREALELAEGHEAQGEYLQ